MEKEKIFYFLRPALKRIRSPFTLKDINPAIERIASAILKKEKISVFGDYDVDGITATTILYEFLKKANANVSFYIPDRIKEGYSLKKNNIERAASNNIDLIITVDCGSNSFAAVEEANKVGIDVIITDHHEISQKPPDACAIINPKQSRCEFEFKELAGVGVAYYLTIGVRKHLRDIGFWNKANPEPDLKAFSDLVALGTIADIVPLVKENRIFVKIGIDRINQGMRIGIEKLKEVSGIEGKINAEDIAFRLAPRLNAAGRIGNAAVAVELLTAQDEKEANKIAEKLNDLNKIRQETEQKALEKIFSYIHRTPDILKKKALVLIHKEWHEGIIGIMASRIAKRFKLPTMLIAINDETGKGSGRSVKGIDLYEVLKKCSHYFEDFGGHPMAAGIKIKIENIKKFKADFERIIAEFSESNDMVDDLTIDRKLDLDDITQELALELEYLQPFGNANPAPIFLAENVKATNPRIVGKNHRKMLLASTGKKGVNFFDAMQFNIDPDSAPPEKFEYLLFKINLNRWNGNTTLQLEIVDFKNS